VVRAEHDIVVRAEDTQPRSRRFKPGYWKECKDRKFKCKNICQIGNTHFFNNRFFKLHKTNIVW